MILAFYPYLPDQCSYLGTMFGFLSDKYQIINYEYAREGFVSLEQIDCIYLNWIENELKEADKEYIERAVLKGIPVVWVFHNRIPHDSDETSALEKITWIAVHSTRIIVHSRRSIDILMKETPGIDPEKCCYIPHPDFCGDYYGGEDLRAKYKYQDKDVVFGFFGLLRRYKNLELLVEAFRGLRKAGMAEGRLLIAGRSESESYARELVSIIQGDENIVLEDHYISALDMKSYLDAVDVLVLPYNKRSSMNSGVMIMAFSCGKTVIVPDIAMAEDFDEKDIYKYYYNNDEEHLISLREIMRGAIRDGREELRRRGKELEGFVRVNHSKNKVKELLLKIV